MLLPRHPAYLEDVNEIGVKQHLDREVDGVRLKFSKLSRSKKISEASSCSRRMCTVFSGRSNESRRVMLPVVSSICAAERFLCARGQHNSSMPTDPQLKLAQEARVVVEKTDVRRAGRIDVSRDAGSAEGLTIDKGEIVDLARLKFLVRQAAAPEKVTELQSVLRQRW